MPLLSAYVIPGCMPYTADNRDEKYWALYSEAHGLGQWCTKQGQNCFHNNTKISFAFFCPLYCVDICSANISAKAMTGKTIG